MAYEFIIGVLLTFSVYQWLGKRHYKRLNTELTEAIAGIHSRMLKLVISQTPSDDILEDEVIE